MKSLFQTGTIALLALAGAAFADGGAAHRAKQTLPIKLGTSGGENNDASSLYCCGGTLGALVLINGQQAILSNNHVLARSGVAVAGDDTIQPGLIDVNCNKATANVVADFAGNLVPLGTSNVDVGVSYTRPGAVDTTGAILDVGVPCNTIQTATVGLAVMKSGRTTGFTTGTITSINTSVTIQYQKGCNQGKKFNVTFTNQIVTGAMSAGGDSGSLLLSNDGTPNPVGLLFAGSTSSTVYNRIQDVVGAFTSRGYTFSFVGNSCGAARGTTTTAEAGAAIAADPENDPGFRFVRDVKTVHENNLLRTPGVLGVGVGKIKDTDADHAIVIYVEKPAKGQAAPKMPAEVDGVKTRIIYTDPFVAQ